MLTGGTRNMLARLLLVVAITFSCVTVSTAGHHALPADESKEDPGFLGDLAEMRGEELASYLFSLIQPWQALFRPVSVRGRCPAGDRRAAGNRFRSPS